MPHVKSIVSDPHVSLILGDEVAAQVRDAVQPAGECVSCGRPLGDEVPLRLDVRDNPIAPIAYTRHASCSHVPVGPAILLPPSSFQYCSFDIPVRIDGRTAKCVVLWMNPQTDVFVVSREAIDGPCAPLLAPYLRHGFQAMGAVPIGTPPAGSAADEVGALSASWLSPVALRLEVLNGDFEVQVPPLFPEVSAELGGFLLVTSFTHHAADVFDHHRSHDVEAMMQTFADESGSAGLWVTLDAIAGRR